MLLLRFALYEDRISPGGAVEYLTPGSSRLLFCLQGSAGLGDGRSISVQEAALAHGNTYVNTGHDGALLWRWELFEDDQEPEMDPMGVTSRLVNEQTVGFEEGEDILFRCESLGMPPADEIEQMRLFGPAIHVCMAGGFQTLHGTDVAQMKPQGAWFINGGETFDLEAHNKEPSMLLRAVILPPVLAGETSQIIPEDQIKPKDGKKRFEKIHTEGIVAL
ncbi:MULTISPECIES: hypothetical protein [Curvivirga]|uniref:hypothetical protein n=1 Tax=Curvivirga TaxID=2856846 RepID=UPI0012BB5890|nr:hypothetical protein [Curvivirga aplysinae]MTI10881.1 hypothetical protein [Curvivirga aplysinae]